MNPDQSHAVIKLDASEESTQVPTKDFVLYFRDDKVHKPVGQLAIAADGSQAVEISILPDFLSASQRQALKLQSKITGPLDCDPNLEY